MTAPADLGLGFPDLFIYALQTQLQNSLSTYTGTPSINYFTRPLRPSDPNYSVGVYEADMEPIEYEIGGMARGTNAGPSLMRWNCAIQVLIKAGEEQEGRAARAKLLNRVRSTLFSTVCITALMTLNDPITAERCTKFRMRRIAYASGDLSEARAKFYIGQVELYWDTEYH